MHGHDKYPHSTAKHLSSHQKIPTARSSLSSLRTALVSLNCSLYQPGAQNKTVFLNRYIRQSFSSQHRISALLFNIFGPDMPVAPSSH